MKKIAEDGLELCDDEELERLKRRSPWLNGRISDADIEEVKQGLLQKLTRPITVRQEDLQPAGLSVPTLFEQFERVILQLQQGEQPPQPGILHNFAQGDSHFKRLFQWGAFGDLVQPLLRPVHYQCYKQQKPARPLQLTGSELECARSALVHSHFVQTPSLALLQLVEQALGAVIAQVLLKDMLLLCVMEWRDAQSFQLVLGFRIVWPAEPGPGQATLVHLKQHSLGVTRQDLFDDAVESFVEAKGLNVNMGWLRDTVRQAPLGYLYCAYGRRD